MTPSTQAENYFNEGFCWFNSHTIKDKSINYSQELSQNPDYDTEQGLCGYILLYSNSYENALGWFNKAIALCPDYVLAYKYRAKALESMERYKEAARDYSIYLKFIPNNPKAFLDLANCISNFDVDKSIMYFCYAIAYKPDYICAYNNRGTIYLKLKYSYSTGDFEKAIELSTQKIENGKAYAINFYYRAWALHKLGRNDEALRDYDISIALNPRHFDSYLSRGNMKYNQKDFEGALLDFKEMVKIDPNNYYCCMMLANCYLETDELIEAMIYCTQSLKIKESITAVHLKNRILSRIKKFY